ncbi:MAG: DUF655 domain-containing protein [Euryarchaeota archaeon]|nr:DUF655 domain-containing protein [Euryarchaeota archaeon]
MEPARPEIRREREDYAWVLDYLPYGHPEDPRPQYQKKPMALAVGEKYFTLMELAPREGKVPQVHQRLYVGDNERDLIDHVKRRIPYMELTQTARMELPFLLEKIITQDEPRFLDVYNKSYPITTRLHMLCLLPGVGQKMMQAILQERKKGEFKNFSDVGQRVKGLYHPEKIVVKRIEQELEDDRTKYRLFTRP